MKTNGLLSALLVLVLTLPAATTAEPVGCDEAVIGELVRMYRVDTSNHEIEILSNRLQSRYVQPGQLSLRPLTEKEPVGLFSVMATVSQSGEELESAQVRLKIRKYAPVLVAIDRIRLHDPLSTDNLALKRMDVTRLREKPITTLDELRGCRSKRNLRKGTILVTGAIEPVPDVEAGREVSIIYADGLCRVSTTGIVMESGMAGEYVRVKNSSSSKIIVARIVDGDVVALDP